MNRSLLVSLSLIPQFCFLLLFAQSTTNQWPSPSRLPTPSLAPTQSPSPTRPSSSSPTSPPSSLSVSVSVSVAPSPTSTPNPSLLVNNNAEKLPLDTHLSAPFGILGAVLILSGAPMAFWGSRNRWSSYFLTGAYAAAIMVMVPILRFGVLEQDAHPTNLVQGMFILACLVAAVAAGGVSVIFWKGTRFLVGAGGGFVISLFILSLRNNVLIRPPGLRWIVIIASTTIGFILATIPKITLYVAVIATAAMGSAAVMIGVDCFTTGGLKEYWIYILGFEQIFPQLHGYFPLTITMQAELGVMAGLCLAGAAVQWRLLELIHKKVQILRQMDRERALVEEAAAYRQSMALDADLASWEKRYGAENTDNDDHTAFSPSPRPHLHERKSSQFSLLPGGATSKGHHHKTASGDQDLPTSPLAAFPSPMRSGFSSRFENGKGIATLVGSDGDDDAPRSPQANDRLLALASTSPTFDSPQLQFQSHAQQPQADELAELEDKMKALEEVKQMRVSVQKLRAELSANPDSSPSYGNNNKTPDSELLQLHSMLELGTADSPSTATRKALPRPLLTTHLSDRPQTIASPPIDFDRYGSERRVGRPPGAPISWSKRMTMVDLHEPSDRFGRPLPLEDQQRVRSSLAAQGPSRIIVPDAAEAVPVEKKVVERRSMTIEQLEGRHKEAIKRLQSTITKTTAVEKDGHAPPGKAQRGQGHQRRPSNQALMGGQSTSRGPSFEQEGPHRLRTSSHVPTRKTSAPGLDHATIPPRSQGVSHARLPSLTTLPPGASSGTNKKNKASWLDY